MLVFQSATGPMFSGLHGKAWAARESKAEQRPLGVLHIARFAPRNASVWAIQKPLCLYRLPIVLVRMSTCLGTFVHVPFFQGQCGQLTDRLPRLFAVDLQKLTFWLSNSTRPRDGAHRRGTPETCLPFSFALLLMTMGRLYQIYFLHLTARLPPPFCLHFLYQTGLKRKEGGGRTFPFAPQLSGALPPFPLLYPALGASLSHLNCWVPHRKASTRERAKRVKTRSGVRSGRER